MINTIAFRKCVLCVALLLTIGFIGRTSSCTSHGCFTLELVQVVFRHGERTPQADEIKLIPNATGVMAEPWGFSQLTNNGKRQEYNIGVQLRKLYGEFLGEQYRPEEVLATSSDYDRTKDSLQLVLASLYPPTNELAWNEDLNWSPIPIHFLPRNLDLLFFTYSCIRFSDMWNELVRTKEIQAYMDQNADLIEHMKQYFPTNDLGLEQFFYLHNIIVIQKSLRQREPDWYSRSVHEKIRLMSKLYLDSLSWTPELARMNGGPLVRRIIENMAAKDKAGANPRKLYLYSGHEFTVYAVAKAHNLTLKVSPAYGSAFIVEKLRDHKGSAHVKINYWNGTNQELTELKLHGCSSVCPLEKYLKIVSPFVATDDDLRCLIKNLTISDLEKILNDPKIGISI
ncbi:venom acid phosphatase Acph-1-like [Copidosoma floridanum]|uniref:venom acid phosphatase Acph-1-like n=1 Tax=Copidosoma floridanum TaxID=29053 RepID=UPI0006C9A743|nr:venom acid phosphatase Acph-1-like [Copidosoma floridanum]